VRSERFAYWERIEGIGKPELYDMRNDPDQHVNLMGDSDYERIWSRLSHELHRFFGKYSEPKYDLWKGGVAKGSVVRPEMFKSLYGESWKPETRILPPFAEPALQGN